MASPSEGEFRRGLASSLAGLGAVLLGIALELSAPMLGMPGLGGAFAFIGLLVAITGAAVVIVGAIQMERSTGARES